MIYAPAVAGRARRATDGRADRCAARAVARQQGELQHPAIDLTAAARAIVDDLEHTEPGHRVAVALAPGLTAHGDSRLVRVVLHNLLGNAWKYTRRADAPRIELGAHDGAFFVRDNGPGFAMEHAARLFQPFERLHGPEYPGSGIGLATVRRIVERHGGRVWAEGAPGAGATFWFTLP